MEISQPDNQSDNSNNKTITVNKFYDPEGIIDSANQLIEEDAEEIKSRTKVVKIDQSGETDKLGNAMFNRKYFETPKNS